MTGAKAKAAAAVTQSTDAGGRQEQKETHESVNDEENVASRSGTTAAPTDPEPSNERTAASAAPKKLGL